MNIVVTIGDINHMVIALVYLSMINITITTISMLHIVHILTRKDK